MSSRGPDDGERLLDPRASGPKGQERPLEIQTEKFMFMLCFFLRSKKHACFMRGDAWNLSGFAVLGPRRNLPVWGH